MFEWNMKNFILIVLCKQRNVVNQSCRISQGKNKDFQLYVKNICEKHIAFYVYDFKIDQMILMKVSPTETCEWLEQFRRKFHHNTVFHFNLQE